MIARTNALPAALPLLLAVSAALAAPPLAVHVPRPTPEQEALMAAEHEAAEALEQTPFALADAERAAEAAPAFPAPPPPPPPPPEASGVPGVPPPPSGAAPAGASSALRPGAASAPAATGAADDSAPFRRDPFWPVSVARERKAAHDASIAAAIEATKRAAAIQKARDEAAAKGLDVSELEEDDLVKLGGGASAAPADPKSPAKVGGATDEEWEAAEAKLPPRSGYLGGRKPALMLKGDKSPHYAGEKLCVTNRNVVFTWRISSVDFRAYTHELRRLKAVPVQGD